MIKLSPSSGFLKRLKKLSQQQQKKIADSLHRFIETPDYPALRFKQLIVREALIKSMMGETEKNADDN